MATPEYLPRLSYAAFSGDVCGVVRALRDGDDIHESVRMVNKQGEEVHGVTPLYLAAQAGHYSACRALLAAGADALRLCSLPTGERFGPADIALISLNFRAWALVAAARRRRLAKLASLGLACADDAAAREPLIPHAAAPSCCAAA
ncbi:MAG: hypothetical protein J3K34DRAFT_400228 [Monoraphidium minutum]|nr:MAG: hypothetical protein J3K34DRAFT_400228 [Monoraphidium minutum]